MLVIFSCNGFSQSQFYLSEVWDMEGGTMPIFYKNASTTDDQRNVYVVGSTNNGSNGNDILIQKFNKLGDLLWEQSFNGGANAEDIGADIFVDASYNVYVTGGATQTTQNNLDLVVLKYNSSGVLQWAYFYNFGGSPIPYDGGTAITGDNNGSIYVTGTSAGTNTMTDFVTIKLNSSNGTQVWTSRYDYAQLNEVPSKIRVSGSSIIVTGASQSTQTPSIKWELATVRYNSSNGSQVGLSRTGGNSSSGIDEANDLTIDNNGNVYVVGATNNQNTGYDITILKFNDDLQLLWQQTFNGHGLEDKGYGIKTDAQGNVYAVGYVTNPNQGKNYSILKYNNSGTLQWSREFNGLANQDDEAAHLVVRGDRIFVTGAARNGAYSDIVTMGYTADGEIFSVKSFESTFGLNDKPTAMGIDLDDNLVIVGQIQQATNSYRNVTFKYNVWEKPIIPVYVDSVPVYNQNEIIIRFDKSAMNLAAVNKKDFEAGELHEFVHPYVIDSMNAILPFDAGKLPTYKIFRKLTTADSLSITRLGDTISVPAFWATLSVMMPEGYNEFDLIDSLNTLSPIMHYGELNGFIKAASVPNDPIYENFQASLHPALLPTPNPNNIDLVNHINIEGAWDIETGDKKIVVGVFDENIYWQHPDLEVAQSTSSIPQLSNTKVVNGKNYYSLNSITAEPIPSHYHGTAVAGIIGAVRNNGIGIAGIAGGDVTINPDNYGVEFISFGILKNNLFLFVGSGASVGLSTTAWEAMLEGALQTTNTFGYGVHLQNLSWQMMNSYPQAYYINTLQQVVYSAWKNQAVLVAARGNNPTPGQGSPTSTMFPACTDDRMILSVGASGTNGLWKNTSNGTPSDWQTFYGQQMDFLAPGVIAMVSTFSSPNFPSPDINIWPSNYRPFDGTSAAAPHVTGVSALMLSKHNYPNNLATEDVEQILQKSARIAQNVILNNPDYLQADWLDSYNYQNAFGLIDAQVALEYVNLPNYFVRHSQPSDILSSNVSLVAQNVGINLTHEDHHFYNNYLSPGNYVADKYEATWLIQVELPSNHEIIDFWPLFSKSCGGFKKPLWDFEYSINHFEHFSFEPSLEDIYYGNTNIGFGTNTLNTITVKATYYFVKTTGPPFFQSINKWLPECGTNNVNDLIPFSFSLHIRENNELSVNENEIENLKVFPNPSDGNLYLSLSHGDIDEIVIFDVHGRIIHQEKNESNSRNVNVYLEAFNSGLHIVQVMSKNGNNYSSKFIKK